jgi:hypothetical protein
MKIISAVLLTALIGVTLACGYSSKATTPAQPGSIPAIAELAPDNTNSGGPGFILTVNGTNFSTKAVVNFNGTAQPTTYVSATLVTAVIAASAIESPATIPVSVTNPAVAGAGAYGSGGTQAETSNTMNFIVN